MAFDRSSLREVLARTDLVAFIGQYVPLKKRGNDFVGLCPFHGEKTPSFHVHPDRGFYKCFGCGKGGDAISFLMERENLPFPEAARMLAVRAGVELEPERPEQARARSEKERMYEINGVAAAYFARILKTPEGERGLAYARGRGLDDATIERFSIGYAPDRWDGLVTELTSRSLDLALAERAGLVRPGQRGYYDFYRDRIMVPTRNTTGEIVAFGGRSVGDGEPKYLNTSTTPVYTKGQVLFALEIARRAAKESGTLVVVEGYLDCIALHQAGITNAVASLGTAFTAEQADELRKYADRIILCYDGDAAGNAAALRAIDIAATKIERAGASLRICVLPAGEDPDSYVRAHGRAAFERLLGEAVPAVQFKLDPRIARLATGFENPAAIAREAEEIVRRLVPREEWDRWRTYVAMRLGLAVDDLRAAARVDAVAGFARPSDTAIVGTRRAGAAIGAPSSERELLAIFIERPELIAPFAESIPIEEFRDDRYRRILLVLLERGRDAESSGELFSLFIENAELLEIVAALGQADRSSTPRYPGIEEAKAHVRRILAHFERERERRRLGELNRAVDALLEAGSPIPDALRQELAALTKRLQA